MCNLYNVTTNQMAIRQFISITHDIIGNMEPSIDVWPDRRGWSCATSMVAGN